MNIRVSIYTAIILCGENDKVQNAIQERKCFKQNIEEGRCLVVDINEQ